MRDDRLKIRRGMRGGRRTGGGKGIQARSKEPEMNRVSECKEKNSGAKVSSLWRGTSGNYYIWTEQKKLLCLNTGYNQVSSQDPITSTTYSQVFCVTIERDPDEQ